MLASVGFLFTIVLLTQIYSTSLGQSIRLYGAKVSSLSSTTSGSTVALRKISNDGSSSQTSDGGSSVQILNFNKATACEDHCNVLCYAVLLLICEEGAASEKERED